MFPALLIILFYLLLVFVFSRSSSRSRLEDENTRILRHTINVNLDILQSELDTLQAIAANGRSSSDCQKASELLQSSAETAKAARLRVGLSNGLELENLLGAVFFAMNQSTEARRLLNACIHR